MLVRHLPRDSALSRAVNGPDVEWGLGEQLLAAIADALHMGNWQRGGNKKAKRPKRIPRPGVKDDATKTLGTGRYTTAEMRRKLDEWGR